MTPAQRSERARRAVVAREWHPKLTEALKAERAAKPKRKTGRPKKVQMVTTGDSGADSARNYCGAGASSIACKAILAKSQRGKVAASRSAAANALGLLFGRTGRIMTAT
jgi:hypothetical protein